MLCCVPLCTAVLSLCDAVAQRLRVCMRIPPLVYYKVLQHPRAPCAAQHSTAALPKTPPASLSPAVHRPSRRDTTYQQQPWPKQTRCVCVFLCVVVVVGVCTLKVGSFVFQCKEASATSQTGGTQQTDRQTERQTNQTSPAGLNSSSHGRDTMSTLNQRWISSFGCLGIISPCPGA